MTPTFEKVVELIVDCSAVERTAIRLDSHLVEDLGLDSVDMFDLVFAIEQEFDIDLNVEEWGEEADAEQSIQKADMVMENFCAHIDVMIAERVVS